MRVSLVLLALLLAPDSARAQHRGYVEALGGATFMATAAGVFGAEAGIHLTRTVIVFGQAGRMMDVLPGDVQEDLDDTAALLQSFTGRPWRFDATVRAIYAGGGIRYLLPIGSRVRVYVVGSAGIVRYTGTLRERELGDVLDQAIALGVIHADDVNGTEAAYEAGAGVVVPRGRLQFDAGYRLMNVRGVNVSRVVAGAGIRF